MRIDMLSPVAAAPRPATGARAPGDVAPGDVAPGDVARDFERMALAQMLSLMEAGADLSDTPFGGGAAERAFRPMLTELWAGGMAERGGIGLADPIRGAMRRMAEGGAR